MIDALIRDLDRSVGDLVEAHSAPERVIDFERYAANPVGFALDVLRIDTLWEAQREHLRAVAESRRVAAYGANGCGKTFDDAILALWWVYCRKGLVVATSAREGQLKEQFMRDVRVLFHQAVDLPGELYTLALRTSNPVSGILCVAAGETSRIRGQHAPRMCVMLQEAQGLEEWVYQAAEMMAVGDADRITVTGNCDLGPVGPFFKVCRLPSWRPVRFNAMAHPNIIEGRVVIPGGPTLASINQRAADYGVDSGFYTSSVLGEFPANTNEGLIQPIWLERAFNLHERGAYVGYMMRGQLVFGVDVARSGADRSCVCIYHGRTVREFIAWRGEDTQVSAAKVMEIARRYGLRPVVPLPQHRGTELLMSGDPLHYEPNTHRAVIRVDCTGLGSGVYDALVHQHWPSEEFISASKPITERHQERFLNRRAEAYFELRDKLEAGELAIPRSDELMRELTAITWQVNGAGRIVIEAKADIKVKLGGLSPDLSDALAMAVTTGGVIDFGCVPATGPIPL